MPISGGVMQRRPTSGTGPIHFRPMLDEKSDNPDITLGRRRNQWGRRVCDRVHQIGTVLEHRANSTDFFVLLIRELGWLAGDIRPSGECLTAHRLENP